MILQSDGYSQVVQGADADPSGSRHLHGRARAAAGDGSYVIVTACRRRGWCCSTRSDFPRNPLANPIRDAQLDTQMIISLIGVTGGTFSLSRRHAHANPASPTTSRSDDLSTALANAGITGVKVTQDGPTYTLDFIGPSDTGNAVPRC